MEVRLFYSHSGRMLISKIYSNIHRIDMRLWIHQLSVKTIQAEPDFVKIDLVKNYIRIEQALILPNTQSDQNLYNSSREHHELS